MGIVRKLTSFNIHILNQAVWQAYKHATMES